MDKYIGMLLDNRYEILDVIGNGGMAVVYYARCRLLNRYVAIKILKDEFANDADFRSRFHTEALAVAKLQHPNIVSVFDVNRSENVEYIVMELVDGMTMKEYLDKKGALPVAEFMHFAPQIASALEHAHSRGIIHRDIKPQNIIILNDGTLKVTDFGIARFTQAPQNAENGETLGSVHYMSPEQAKGSAIDARSDIYSFGIMMYEMLTGRLPFEGETVEEVLMKHVSQIPAMPRELEPSIPAALEQIVMHAMTPRVRERYSSASEIVRDLERYQKNPEIVFPYKLPNQEKKTASDNDSKAHNIWKKAENSIVGIWESLKQYQVDDADEKRKSEPRKRTSVFVYIITAVLTAAIFLGGATFIITTIFNTASAAEETSAPDLVGLKLDDVLSSSELGSKFNIVEEATVYNADVDAGIIISQTPAKGRTIKADTEIKVTVSLGAKMVTLPDLTQSEYRNAQLRLTEMELNYNKIYEASDTVNAGSVIRTEPSANTELVAGSEVTLVISTGKETVMVKAPELLGHTEEEARQLLETNKLKIGEVLTQVSNQEVGTIVRQSVEKDTEVPEGTEVDIYVSVRATSVEVQGTTTAAPVEVKKIAKLEVPLPSDAGENVLVTVKTGNEVLMEKSYPASEGTARIELTGNGSILAQVYINNVFVSDQVLIFE